jgi:putative DNA primase/helicase
MDRDPDQGAEAGIEEEFTPGVILPRSAPEEGEKPKRRRRKRESEPRPRKGPLIRLRGGNLHVEATEGEDALLGAQRPVFQRGNGLVRPTVQVVQAAKGRSTNSAALVEINMHGLTDMLCQVATWERFDARSEEWVEINPPGAVAQTILARVGDWKFPRLAGVITTPTLRPDGSILHDGGYDPATRLYLMPDPSLKLSAKVWQPTKEEAEQAARLLLDLLEEFPFVGGTDKAVALSGLITPTVRGAMAVAPLHAFRAYTAGTGKSYLVDVASAIATGRPCPVTSAAAEEAETEKRIAGMLLAGFPVACLDNVNGELGGDLLCQAIERPLIRLRPLGRSDIIEIESRASLFATGNALRVRGDMTRRTLVCSLDAKVERPELREFHSDPVATVLADRGRYVSACIAIVRAYAAAGAPGQLKPIASFEEWSNTVRSALVWLGYEDPAKSMEAAREDDPELTELREVMGLWFKALGIEKKTAKEVADLAESKHASQMGEPGELAHPEFREVLHRLVGERGQINTKRLGRWLLSREGRMVGEQRFKRGAKLASGGVMRWGVELPKREEA